MKLLALSSKFDPKMQFNSHVYMTAHAKLNFKRYITYLMIHKFLFSMFPHYRYIRKLERYDDFGPIGKVIPDRTNPFEAMTEDEFLMKFRLNKECTISLIQRIEHQLPHTLNNRGKHLCVTNVL